MFKNAPRGGGDPPLPVCRTGMGISMLHQQGNSVCCNTPYIPPRSYYSRQENSSSYLPERIPLSSPQRYEERCNRQDKKPHAEIRLHRQANTLI